MPAVIGNKTNKLAHETHWRRLKPQQANVKEKWPEAIHVFGKKRSEFSKSLCVGNITSITWSAF